MALLEQPRKFYKTDFKYITGKLKWVKNVHADAKFNCWSLVVYPNSESLETFKKLQEEGVKNHLNKDEDGYYITFRRPTHKLMGGALVPFAPPEVIDKEGRPIHVPIGDGSDGVVKLEVYTHGTPSGGKSKAARWLSLRVDNLVPHEKEMFDDGQLKAIEGLDKQPSELF